MRFHHIFYINYGKITNTNLSDEEIMRNNSFNFTSDGITLYYNDKSIRYENHREGFCLIKFYPEKIIGKAKIKYNEDLKEFFYKEVLDEKE